MLRRYCVSRRSSTVTPVRHSKRYHTSRSLVSWDRFLSPLVEAAQRARLPAPALPFRGEPPTTLPRYAYYQIGIFAGRALEAALWGKPGQRFDTLRDKRNGASPNRRDAYEVALFDAGDSVERLARLPHHAVERTAAAFGDTLHLIEIRAGEGGALRWMELVGDELRRLDTIFAVDESRLVTSAPVDRAIFRGRAGAGDGAVATWLARLISGRHGLLWRCGPAWRWLEGERDEVLAHVPDEHFEAAANAACA